MSECRKGAHRATWQWPRNNALYVICQSAGKVHIEQRDSGPGTMHCMSRVGVQERCMSSNLTVAQEQCHMSECRKGACRATWQWPRNNALYVTCRSAGKVHVEQPDSGPGTMHCTSHVGVQERCTSSNLTVTQEQCIVRHMSECRKGALCMN